MNAVYERFFRRPTARTFPDGFRHRAVCDEHKLLDQFVRVLRLLEIHAQGTTLVVDLELHLVAIKVDGTLREPSLAEFFSQTVQRVDLFAEISVAGLYRLLCLVVSETAVTTNHRPHDA